MRRWLMALVCLATGCVARSEGPAAAPFGAPFVAWLEVGDATAEGRDVTLVVLPLRPLGAPLEVLMEGRTTQVMAATGGRRRFALTREEAMRFEVSWRDPGGAAGARAVLEYPERAVATAAFVPIVGYRLGRSGLVIDQAIRIPPTGEVRRGGKSHE